MKCWTLVAIFALSCLLPIFAQNEGNDMDMPGSECQNESGHCVDEHDTQNCTVPLGKLDCPKGNHCCKTLFLKGYDAAGLLLTKTHRSSSCNECGISNRRSRIVGGDFTKENEYPWQVAFYELQDDCNKKCQRSYCGGSIINSRWILTAAHCSVSIDDQVIVGAHDLSRPNNRKVDIERVIPHRFFNESGKIENDISLVKLVEDLDFSDENLAPVCLPPACTRKTYAGRKAIVSGWGTTKSDSDDYPSELKKVEIDVIKNSQCKKSGNEPWEILHAMLCAGTDAGGKASCSGDSGGPLVIKEWGKYVQIGVDSWGKGCGLQNYYGVYTRVTSHIKWILKRVGSYGICTIDHNCP